MRKTDVLGLGVCVCAGRGAVYIYIYTISAPFRHMQSRLIKTYKDVVKELTIRMYIL